MSMLSSELPPLERRTQILSSALDVIAEEGIAGATYRRIAKRAAVTLGSLTYKFDSIENLIEASFSFFAQTNPSLYLEVMDGDSTIDKLVSRFERLISDDYYTSKCKRTISISLELYAYANKNPSMEATVQTWRQRNQDALASKFDLLSAKLINALVEGVLIFRIGEETYLTGMEFESIIRLVIKNNFKWRG